MLVKFLNIMIKISNVLVEIANILMEISYIYLKISQGDKNVNTYHFDNYFEFTFITYASIVIAPKPNLLSITKNVGPPER